MPKSIIIEPEQAFARGTIHLSDIPVNAYQKSLAEEVAAHSREDLLAMWQDMCAIREFESILQEIKTKGTYKGITYNHAGPAHLSIGQEAAAVGMAFSLTPDDHIFGSHRSHGEILAKGFSAIRHFSEERLLEIMRNYRDGAILRPAESGFKGTVADLALRFFIYGAYSEIFARETGFNRGLGGSMHAFFTPFGIYPNNAIVGGSGPSRPARRCSSASTVSRASWSATSATPRSAAGRCGKASRSPPWTSTARSGTNPWAAACPS